mmetsp:Transcript_20885/g.53876  ORF Transcript_20885/g.53876 Transcript_20885/m.53876 type:complete len:245 (-) Transcript_20885:250-984(-)
MELAGTAGHQFPDPDSSPAAAIDSVSRCFLRMGLISLSALLIVPGESWSCFARTAAVKGSMPSMRGSSVYARASAAPASVAGLLPSSRLLSCIHWEHTERALLEPVGVSARLRHKFADHARDVALLDLKRVRRQPRGRAARAPRHMWGRAAVGSPFEPRADLLVDAEDGSPVEPRADLPVDVEDGGGIFGRDRCTIARLIDERSRDTLIVPPLPAPLAALLGAMAIVLALALIEFVDQQLGALD